MLRLEWDSLLVGPAYDSWSGSLAWIFSREYERKSSDWDVPLDLMSFLHIFVLAKLVQLW